MCVISATKQAGKDVTDVAKAVGTGFKAGVTLSVALLPALVLITIIRRL